MPSSFVPPRPRSHVTIASQFGSAAPARSAVAVARWATGSLAFAYPNRACVSQLAPRRACAGYLAVSRSRRPVGTAVIQPRVEARACPSFYPGFAFPASPTLKGLNRLLRVSDATLTGLAAVQPIPRVGAVAPTLGWMITTPSGLLQPRRASAGYLTASHESRQ